MLWQYSDGDTPNWNIKYRGMKKLRLLTSVSLYNTIIIIIIIIQDMAIVAVVCE